MDLNIFGLSDLDSILIRHTLMEFRVWISYTLVYSKNSMIDEERELIIEALQATLAFLTCIGPEP